MDMNIFHEFITLATRGSFVSAARELNMSQPALSRHVAMLEKHLKHKLLYDTRPISLTAAGEVVLRHSGKLIHDYQNMVAELASMPASKNEHILIQDLLHANTLYIGINEALKAANEEFGTFQLNYVNTDHRGLNAQQLVESDKVDISFETTLSLEELPKLDMKEDVEPILIPEFHGSLVLGIPRGSAFAIKENLRLKDIRHARFIMQMNLLSERFVKDFISICELEGFYPNISFVPTSNSLEFYSADPKDGIHLLVAVKKEYQPIIADLVKKHVRIRALSDVKVFGNAFALVKKENKSPVMEFLTNHMRQHAKEFIDTFTDTDIR